MSIKKNNIVSLILNIAMVILVIKAVGYFFSPVGLKEGIGNMESGGTHCFMFFTIDSNILAALTSLLLIPFNIKSLLNNKNELPSWAIKLKYVGTCAVTVTLMVVIFFLGPTQGYKEMFSGSCFELHLTCPLLSIISFILFEKGIKINKKEILLGVFPVIIYGIVYATMVIFTKQWIDFYGFNIGGYWYISFVVMLFVTYLLSLIIAKLHNIFD